MAWIPIYILILFLIIGVDYFAAQKIEQSTGQQRKLFLGASIFANVGLLAMFKYYGFLAENFSRLFGLLNLSVPFPALNLIFFHFTRFKPSHTRLRSTKISKRLRNIWVSMPCTSCSIRNLLPVRSNVLSI
jgi:hypothetical protein